MSYERGALAAALITAVSWGLTGVFVRLLPPVSPVAITSGRLLVALLFVLPALSFMGTNIASLRVASRRPASLVFAGLLTAYYLLATTAFQFAPVAEVMLLISTSPIFVLALRSLRRDIPRWLEFGGAVIAVAGMVLVMLPNFTATHPDKGRILGDLLAITAASSTACYAFVFRILGERGSAPDAVAVSFLTFLLGGVVLLCLTVLVPGSPRPAVVDAFSMTMLLGLGVISTAVPTLAFSLASKTLPPLVTSTLFLLTPLFGGVFAYLILHERLSATFFPGAVLVLIGLVVILRNSGSKPSPALPETALRP